MSLVILTLSIAKGKDLYLDSSPFWAQNDEIRVRMMRVQT